ncbi:MAG: hypothetical protein R3E39_01115 [Anaerolineae bacterium]
MRRTVSMFLTVGIMVGIWLLLFQLVGIVDFKSPLNPSNRSVSANSSYDRLAEQVTPPGGKTIQVVWGNMGQKLINAGAIDLNKFEAQYGSLSDEQREILLGDSLQEITLTADNIQFWTNVLWSLGLTQQSKVLGEGLMTQRAAEVPIGNYASTGGWILGSKDPMELYNSARLIELTPEQDAMVYQVAEHIFRPCCGNHTAYPDCNHGMAVLGLLELMASRGGSERDLYEAALTFNSYAFSSTYLTLAAYFEGQGASWLQVDAVTALGSEYSSAQGAKRIAAEVGPIPGAPTRGGGCSA